MFSKIKARLGGRVKLIVSGGAPLAGHVEDFLKITMCAPVVQACPLPFLCTIQFLPTISTQTHFQLLIHSARLCSLFLG